MPSFRLLAFFSIFLSAVSVASPAANTPSQRTLVKEAMALRPADPWPRGIGHVVYAWPGSNEQDKGYEEPGGRLLCTSASIPVHKVSQRFQWEPRRALPGIVVETPYYTATWSLSRPGNYTLHLHPKHPRLLSEPR